MSNKYIVITSINKLTEGVKQFAEHEDWQVILVGDKKSPHIEENPHPKVTYLSIETQSKLGFNLFQNLPFNHYSRKNLGYLFAIKNGATLIADTDDDNIPYPIWGKDIEFEVKNFEMITGHKFLNVYRLFTNKFIWPRGFPLARIKDQRSIITKAHAPNEQVAIWQGLADRDPDVDAIFRLLFDDGTVFDERDPVLLGEGVYCPFNSQNTFWFPIAFPFLYLPVYVTFRFTDILRGYIAQRYLHVSKLRLAFTQATVFQDRNEHNLMKDFKDEIPCYLQTEELVRILDETNFDPDDCNALSIIYQALFKHQIVTEDELTLVKAWTDDLEKLCF